MSIQKRKTRRMAECDRYEKCRASGCQSRQVLRQRTDQIASRRSPQSVEQSLRLLQILRVKALGEPGVDRREEIERFLASALIDPPARRGPLQLEVQAPWRVGFLPFSMPGRAVPAPRFRRLVRRGRPTPAPSVGTIRPQVFVRCCGWLSQGPARSIPAQLRRRDRINNGGHKSTSERRDASADSRRCDIRPTPHGFPRAHRVKDRATPRICPGWRAPGAIAGIRAPPTRRCSVRHGRCASQELAAKGMKNARIVTCIRLRMRMTDGVGTPNGGVHSRNCRIGAAEQPERPRHQRQVGHAGILAGRTRRQPILLAARLERFVGPFDHFMGTGEMSHEKPDHRPARASH